MTRRPTSPALAIVAVLTAAGVGMAGCGKPNAGNTVASTSPGPSATAPSAAAGPNTPPPPDPCPSIGTLAEAKGPIVFDSPRVVRLNTVCPAGAMTEHLRSYGQGVRYILVADDLRAGAQPGAAFELSLGPPSTGEAAVIGTINVFSAQQSNGFGQPHSISFDVTRQVQSLAISGWPEQGLGVAVAPSGPAAPGAPGADTAMGAIRLIAQGPR